VISIIESARYVSIFIYKIFSLIPVLFIELNLEEPLNTKKITLGYPF